MTGSCSPFSSTNSLTAVCDGCQKTSHGKFKATRCAFVRRPAAEGGYTTYHREAVIRQFARQSSSRSHTCTGDDLAWPPVATGKKKIQMDNMFVLREDWLASPRKIILPRAQRQIWSKKATIKYQHHSIKWGRMRR